MVDTDADVILFYSPKDQPHGVFSNFARGTRVRFCWSPFQVDAPTSEHAFQAFKFFVTDKTWANAILLAPTPKDAADMGRSREHRMDPRWERIKDDVMRYVVFLKFNQNREAQSTLLGTGNHLLMEHTSKDSYWGNGGDNSGRNMLGRILMEVRGVFQDQNPEAKRVFIHTVLMKLLAGPETEEARP